MLFSTPEYNFVFLAPEIAVTPYMLDVFLKMKCNGTISYIVIDECHCTDMWGFDFRPAYANLSCLTELNCQVIALTATCSPRTEDVILSSLNLHKATVIRQTCDRPNISLSVQPKKGDGKEKITKMILEKYFDPFKKQENAQAWLDGKALVICATIAFGMGINKPNVRFIIHSSISQSMDCYAQEFGRAGRDGNESTNSLLFRLEDRTKQLQMIASTPDSEHKAFKIQNLRNEMSMFCIKP